jgi:cytochrome c553
MYPRLLGQRYTYLVAQLQQWRDGRRNNDALSQMQIVAQKLTDEDIYNVATFLTSAPESTLGNGRVPHLQ